MESFILVKVPHDTYRADLITNPDLKRSYGKLEWTERGSGAQHSKKLDNIERYEIVGIGHTLTLKGKESKRTYIILKYNP